MASTSKKVAQLQRELQSASPPDFSLARQITPSSIRDLLQRKTQANNIQIDWEIFEQLIDRLQEKVENSDISFLNWQEFCHVYIEAESMLKSKIANARKILEDCFVKRGEVDSKLIDARSSELLNQYGIAYNSHATITVKQLQLSHTLYDSSQLQPYVSIKVGQNSNQTPNVQGSSYLFNNTFDFSVATGQETIQISVMHFDRASHDSLLGGVTIPLTLLKDQFLRENVYILQSIDRKEVGQITLSTQWLHSQEKYLSDTLMQWDEHIRGQEESMIQFQQDLAVLYSPFPDYLSLLRTDIPSHTTSQYANVSAHLRQENTSSKLDFKGQPNHTSQTVPQYEKIDLRGVALQGVIEVDKSLFDSLKVFLAIFAITTLISHMYRPQFIDWMITLVTMLYYNLHIFDHSRARVILFTVIASIVLDFFWIYIYSTGWWNGYSDDKATISIIDSNLRRLAIFMSYVSFILKFPLAVILYRLNKELEKQLEGKRVVKEQLQSTLNFNRSPEYAATSLPFSNINVPVPGQINRQYIVNADEYSAQASRVPFSNTIHHSVQANIPFNQSMVYRNI